MQKWRQQLFGVAVADIMAVGIADLRRKQRADGVVGIEPGQVGAEQHALRAGFGDELLEDAAVIEQGGQFEVDVGEITRQGDGGVPIAVH